MKAKKPVTIGVLGSACNPPHVGHAAIGKCAEKTLKLDRLIVMPTKYPPHKEAPAVSGKMRFAMARIMAKKCGWKVSTLEIKRVGKSYTADTIAELKKKYPHAKLHWIIGSDALLSMPKKWKFGYDVLDHCQFIVTKRRGYPLRRTPAAILKKIIVLKRPALNSVSSTMAREAIRRGNIQKTPRLLEPEILSFITRNRLYSYAKS